LLLDKPTEITSNYALKQVKKLFNQIFKQKIKAGHTGSLDPLATGMLPICIGEATKFARFLLDSDKQYIVTMQLGIKTDTGDIDGNIIQELNNWQEVDLSPTTINRVLDSFIGKYNQVPPIYSAIKKDGVAYYKIARKSKAKGEDLQQLTKPAARLIEIYQIKLLNICKTNKLITLQVHCSKGTYIRSLVEDIAVKLNCLATVRDLRRIAIGNFLEQDLVNLSSLMSTKTVELNSETFQQELLSKLLPLQACLASLKTYKVASNLALKLQQGQVITIENPIDPHVKANTPICIVEVSSSKLIGIGEITADNKLVPKRLLKLA